MASEWREAPLGDAITLQRGFDLPAKDRQPGKIPVVTSSGISGTHSEAKVSAPGVVTGRYGTVGQVFYIKEDFWPHNTALFVKDFKGNDAHFISFLLRTIDFNSCSDKSGVPGVNRNHLHLIKVRIPPLDEQQAIARILGTLDNKIELNRRMNEMLEAMARSLFKSWFVDFDPVHARAENRQPAGMDAATAALFPSSFEESPLGLIPKRWRVSTLSEVAEINSWTLNKRDELERVEYIEISEVMRGDVLNVQAFTRGQEPSRARRRLRHGDTVISTVRPDRGSYFLCLNPSPCLIASTGFAVFTPTKAPWSFVHAAATQPDIFPFLGRLADGGAYPAISPEAICKWEIAIPAESQLIAKYDALCAPLFQLSAANRVNSCTLAALRDALLPKLLSGEIRVREAEREVEQVA
jgi:type I restriction enzyme S subunit